MDNMYDERVCFHVGRGGRFNNAGHKEFLPNVHSFADLLIYCGPDICLVNEDEDGNSLKAKDWYICDNSGRHLVEGRNAIMAKTGELDFDGDYDRYYVKRLEDCSKAELKIIVELYEQRPHLIENMSVVYHACEELDKKQVDGDWCIKTYKSNMVIFYNGDENFSTLTLYRDKFEDEDGNAVDEDEAIQDLKEMGFLDEAIDMILSDMRIYGWVK